MHELVRIKLNVYLHIFPVTLCEISSVLRACSWLYVFVTEQGQCYRQAVTAVNALYMSFCDLYLFSEYFFFSLYALILFVLLLFQQAGVQTNSENRRSYICGYKNCYVYRPTTVHFCRQLPSFSRKLVPPSSGWKSKTCSRDFP